jgi:hypothetical protein
MLLWDHGFFNAHSSNTRRPQAVAPKLVSYKLRLLSEEAPRQLFRYRADRQDATDAGPAGLEDRVISACGGLPLALQLAGGILRGNCSKNMWQVRPFHNCVFVKDLPHGLI